VRSSATKGGRVREDVMTTDASAARCREQPDNEYRSRVLRHDPHMIVRIAGRLAAVGVAMTSLAGCSSNDAPGATRSATAVVTHHLDRSRAADPAGARSLPDDVDSLFPPASTVGAGFARRGPLPEDVRPVPYENAAYENRRTGQTVFLTLFFYADAPHAAAAVSRAVGNDRLPVAGPLATVGAGGAFLPPRRVPVGTRRDAVLSQGRVFVAIVTAGPDATRVPVGSVVRFARAEVGRLQAHGY
jgi:hypothetical protein